MDTTWSGRPHGITGPVTDKTVITETPIQEEREEIF